MPLAGVVRAGPVDAWRSPPALKARNQTSVVLGRVQHADDHFSDAGLALEVTSDHFEHHSGAKVRWGPVVPRTHRRNGQALDPDILRPSQGIEDRRTQFAFRVLLLELGADSMDDVLCLEVPSGRDNGLSERDRGQLLQFLLDRGSAPHGDRAPEARAEGQIRLGVEHERVDVEVGDIVLDEADSAPVDLYAIRKCVGHCNLPSLTISRAASASRTFLMSQP